MLRKFLLITCLYLTVLSCYGQVVTECPQNIGFENGTLSNWESYTGIVGGRRYDAISTGVVSLSLTAASPGRQTLIKRGSGVDPYGEFSLDAPNGSDYVVLLGNDNTQAEAESISYTLEVPSNVSAYSIIFNYAVVFQNPNHGYDEQPKFTAKIIDVASNTITECGSFEFVAQGGLPGFEVSARNPSVLFKPWSPVLVNLSNYLGHTIRLEFTTNDCTRGGHFGYAYIDFNENCSIPITGNVTCPQTASITLKTLPGFFQYNWFNATTSESLGTSESLVLSPVPPVGTVIGVELVPYQGLGCTQSLYTTINNMDLHINDPPGNCTSVDITTTSVTVGNSSDLTYSYWKDINATRPIPDPRKVTSSGTYYIKGTSSSGCYLVKEVHVTIIPGPLVTVVDPDPVNYPGTVDITASFPHDEGVVYSYWRNYEATVPLPNPGMVGKKGIYYIKAVNSSDCVSVTQVTVDILIPDIVIPNTFTPNGDGVNDVLTVLVNSKINIKSFRIYNRWGVLVYETPDINNYWTGIKENRMMPVGSYYWVIEGEEGSQRYRRSGSVTIIR